MRMAKKTERDPDWIESEDAAKLMGIEPDSLSNWRNIQRSNQPRFYKYSEKHVRYKRSEVLAWIEKQAVDYASDATT